MVILARKTVYNNVLAVILSKTKHTLPHNLYVFSHIYLKHFEVNGFYMLTQL